MSDIFLGIDIGGTKTTIGAVSRDEPDKIVASATIPTVAEDPARMVRTIADAVRDSVLPASGASAVSRVLAVGIGSPGPLDLIGGSLGALPNLPRWRGFHICVELQAMLGAPCFLDNDANIAGLGELAFGAGKDMQDFIFVTLGTGIGGAVIAGGRLVSGRTGGAGEIGHITVDPEGPSCGCGRRGCVEAYASGPSIQRAYGMPAAQVFSRAAAGEERAKDVLTAAGHALGVGLAWAVTLLDPQAIIFGGGMSQGDPAALAIYLDGCRAGLRENAYHPQGTEIPFLKSPLGPEVAVLGAAWLARERWEGSKENGKQGGNEGGKQGGNEGGNEGGNKGIGAGAELPAPGPVVLKTVAKPWGEEVWWARTPVYVGKRISVWGGHSLSLQYHRKKVETLFFVSGSGEFVLGEQRLEIRPDLSVNVPAGVRHRVIAQTDLVFYEVSTPEVDDVVRIEDAYGRV